VKSVSIIGGGPAGLMAAEVISQQGIRVDVYDAMPSLGRKFLMAGKSGLNLTHAEEQARFLSRYGDRRQQLEPIIRAFDARRLRDWAAELGIETFVGSSGRVFPKEMKAAPLLRAWLHRLRASGVRVHVRHQWLGFDNQQHLRFTTPQGEIHVKADATVLAMGGGSWSRLGSTGTWVSILQQAGITVMPLLASNCGFDVNWSAHLRERFAGAPVKSVSLSLTDDTGTVTSRQGDFVMTQNGIEGSLVYAFSGALRDQIARHGSASLLLDLLPAYSVAQVTDKLTKSRGKRSLSEHLRKQLGLTGVKAALLYELLSKSVLDDPQQLAQAMKALPICCLRTRPIDEAISTAGGVAFSELDAQLMLRKRPGVFCAGEMLDWDAPTGGYLLTACFASGYAAGQGVKSWLQDE